MRTEGRPPKKTKNKQELDAVPDAKIHFVDMDSEAKELAIQTAKVAYLAKKKGEAKYWTGNIT